METLLLTDNHKQKHPVEGENNNIENRPFIVANTIGVNLDDVRDKHLIPVFAKDNQPVISQSDFIELTTDIVHHVFQKEAILRPSIRVSHPIKGRVSEAKDKPAHLLLEEEKTIYYERMAFAIEVPSISTVINGNPLSLTIGGIKAHHQDNLYGRKGMDEHFKIFIGFENKVCTNMCIWSDGLLENLKVRSVDELTDAIIKMVSEYNAQSHLDNLKKFTEFYLTENQFAHLIGKARMYHHLPPKQKNQIQELSFGDTQIGLVVKEYYNDKSFCRENDGSINVWKLFNLFTSANKSSYIDSFLNRGLNAHYFIESITNAIEKGESNWFLN